MDPSTVKIRGGGEPLRCPYCHLPLGETMSPAEDCGHCGARSHSACLDELRRCATCDAPLREPDPLMDAPPGRRTDPGTLQVERGADGSLRIEKSLINAGDAAIALLSQFFCLFFPPVPLLIPWILTRRRAALRLGERDLIATCDGGSLGLPREVRLRRDEVRGVHLHTAHQRLELVTDHEHYKLVTWGLTQGCTPEELRWIADQVRRWRLPARDAR